MAFFADLLSPPPTFVNVFPISLGKKCPVSLFQSMVSYLPGAREEEAFRRAGNARFPRQGDTGGRIQWEDGQLPAAGQTPGNSFGRDGGTGSFGEQPKPRVTARTDVFRLSFRPDVRLRPCSLPKWSETDAGTEQPVRQGAGARQ